MCRKRCAGNDILRRRDRDHALETMSRPAVYPYPCLYLRHCDNEASNEVMMSCCDETTARVPSTDFSRRSLLKSASLAATVIPTAATGRAEAQTRQITLAYCSQLLCGVPYEVARTDGYFKNHGLDVQLVYTRGGNAAMQALIGGAVDYAATALDVALQAYVNVGANIRRFAVTGRLPLLAVVTAP